MNRWWNLHRGSGSLAAKSELEVTSSYRMPVRLEATWQFTQSRGVLGATVAVHAELGQLVGDVGELDLVHDHVLLQNVADLLPKLAVELEHQLIRVGVDATRRTGMLAYEADVLGVGEWLKCCLDLGEEVRYRAS